MVRGATSLSGVYSESCSPSPGSTLIGNDHDAFMTSRSLEDITYSVIVYETRWPD